jgi:hypothetical protein
MEKKRQYTLAPSVDYVTVLIILFFVLLTIGVFIYFKHRINAIDSEIRQSSYAPVKTQDQVAKAVATYSRRSRSH